MVVESLGFEPEGEGKHVLVNIRKIGYSAQFVANHLASFASIHACSFGYAGLKIAMR
jgi:tRNA pseudouridine13 synthase